MAGRVFSMVELSGLLNVNRNTLAKWVGQGCPYLQKANRLKGQEWQFDLPAVVEWLEKRAVEKTIGDTSKMTLEDAKLRKTSAEASIAEYELARLRRTMIGVDEMREIVADEYATVRSRLMTISSRLAQQLAEEKDPAQIERLVQAEISDALQELAADGGPDADGAGSY